MLEIEFAGFDLVLDQNGLNSLIADGTALTSFQRAQPSIFERVDEMKNFFTRVDSKLKKASGNIQLHIFETNGEAIQDNLWILDSHGVQMETLFSNEFPIFAYLSWSEKTKDLSGEFQPMFFLEVAIDMSKDHGKKYFDNLLRLLTLPPIGSKFVINAGFALPPCFRSQDGSLKDMSLVSCYPCKSVSILTKKL